MPPPSYNKTQILPLAGAWELLANDSSWEIAERYAGGHLKVGTPPIRPRSGLRLGAVATAFTSPNAREGLHGIKIDSPAGPAGARWVGDRQEALAAYGERLRDLGERAVGKERLYRVQLWADGEIIDEQLVASGEISPDPEVLDGLSLTYVGVLASIALAFAFGIPEIAWWVRVVLALVLLFGLAVLLRTAVSRRWVTRFARWALPGAHEAAP